MKHTIWAASFLIALMIGCGAEPTPIPPKRTAPSPQQPPDAEVLSRAIDFVYEKVDIPKPLQAGQNCLIVQRQSMMVEYCKETLNRVDVGPFVIKPNAEGYLDFKGIKNFDLECFPYLTISEAESVSQSQKEDYFRRNQAVGFLPSIQSSRCIRLVESQKIHLLNKGGLSNFDDAGPPSGGLLRITLPGYSIDKTKACLFLEFYAGPDWASSWGLFLEIVHGQWSVTDSRQGWIS